MEYHYSNSKDVEMETQNCYPIASAHIAINGEASFFFF